ncbi:MAG: ATP-binding cassette domain-containing protein, partial [Patescibacteria group bacterium]
GNGRAVIENVSLEIPKGARVALVGHTGSGKSTLANLLLRFYDATEGSVKVDGTDIRDFTVSSYRSKFAAVFQDTTLFNDTLRANLEYVKDGVTFEEVREACRKAEILDFIESLPDGFDTVVGERGLKLSGGEKQRVSIARAIIADPDVLVLDEATSALDSRTEARIQKAFDALMAGRTSLVIAHRLSTVVGSDRIFVVDSGKVSDSGNHSELYAKSASYRELVDAQKNGFFSDEIPAESP